MILGKGIQLFGGADPDATTEVPFVNSDYARSPVMKASFPVLASNTIIRFDDDGEYYFTPYTLDSYLFMKDASGTSFSQTNNCFRIEDDELVYYRDNKKVGVVADIPDYFTGTASVSISGSFFVIHPNSYYFSDLIDTEALNLGDVLTPGVTGQFDSIQVDGNSTVYTNANIEVTNKGLFDTNETTATPIDRIYESDKAFLITSESTYGSNYTLEQIDFALPAITMPLQQ